MLLDLGCGPGLLLDYLRATGRLECVDYRGIDLSPVMVEAARARWPGRDISCRDIVADPLLPDSVDFVDHERRADGKADALSRRDGRHRPGADRGGVQRGPHRHRVQRDEPPRRLGAARALPLGIRRVECLSPRTRQPPLCVPADYGLYEYTAFVWRAPRRPAALCPKDWWER